MTGPAFSRVVLRTTQVDAARGFYEAVLGHAGDGVVELPAQARARGAVPHWLPLLGVEDVPAAEQALVARGGQRLGAPSPSGDVVVRQAGGSLLGLTASRGPSRARVGLYVLNSRDAEQARDELAAVFGWSVGAALELPGQGVFHEFSYRAREPVVGVVGDIAGRPGVHPHWTVLFEVRSLPAAVECARRLGATVGGELTLPDGTPISVLDDPWGAAFGVMEGHRAGLRALWG